MRKSNLLIDNIPAELRGYDQWICWRSEERDGKPTKIPVSPHGGKAKVNDPATWATFDDAVAALHIHKCDGLGFVFTEDDPFVGIDLDKVTDEQGRFFNSTLSQIVDTVATYIERSPSGTGLHIIAKGRLPGERRRHKNIEMYSEGRYFTVTGVKYGAKDRPVLADQPTINQFYDMMMPAAVERPQPQRRPETSANGKPRQQWQRRF